MTNTLSAVFLSERLAVPRVTKAKGGEGKKKMEITNGCVERMGPSRVLQLNEIIYENKQGKFLDESCYVIIRSAITIFKVSSRDVSLREASSPIKKA